MISLSLVKRLLLTVSLIATPALAQISGGAFRGEIRDESSAIVPQARITIQSRETGVEVVTESNGDGLYITPNLVPGSYLLMPRNPDSRLKYSVRLRFR